MNKILADASICPAAFLWCGALDPSELASWLGERANSIPMDLLGFWKQTGGGDMFESESMLCPIPKEPWQDDLDEFNAALQRKGLPKGYLVFHHGLGISAIRIRDKAYVLLREPSFREEGVFADLDEWYQSVLRSEYARRYGLR